MVKNIKSEEKNSKSIKNKGKITKEKSLDKFTTHKLYRSNNDKIIAGIAGGLGKYLSIDPTIIRILFILTTFFGGSGILLYLILWFIIPKEPEEYTNKSSISEKPINITMYDIRNLIGTIIIIIGVTFLIYDLGWFSIDFKKLWPIWLILGGYLILAGAKNNSKN